VKKIILDPKTWAILVAILVPIILIIASLGYKNWGWSFVETTGFVAAYGGTLAGLAGFLFVYVNFNEQQKQFLQQHAQFEKQTFESAFFQLLTNLRISGPIDRLTPIYKELLLKITPMCYSYEVNDGIPFGHVRRQNFEEIIQSKYLFAEKVEELGGPYLKTIKDALNQLLAVLKHLDSDRYKGKNHLDTLVLSLSNEEFFVLYYFYIARKDDLIPVYQMLLNPFFSQMDNNVLYDKRHILWNESPKIPNN
tara:strand:- start:583 stop:1335 length:753 start_codon:yes stop_codon:yes gene_type:complete